MATHKCTRCGEDKPLEEFPKHRMREAGNKWASRAAWYCDGCVAAVDREWHAKHPGYTTERVRRWRQDPENRERDRAASRRWKAANRERNRARDRERVMKNRPPCPKCGEPMRRHSNQCINCREAAENARRSKIAEMWVAGATLREIAEALGTTRDSVGVSVHLMRRDGWDLPYRYRRVGKRVAA